MVILLHVINPVITVAFMFSYVFDYAIIAVIGCEIDENFLCLYWGPWPHREAKGIILNINE